ncbi:MAG: hypothetical protein GXO93_02600 [FCB group bacterium]|nr:hypothetical protein [FCB group bacterium]
MKNIIYSAILLSFVLVLSCTSLRTRQFIAYDMVPKADKFEGWKFESPQLVAFKEVSKLDSISDTNMFWLTVIAYHEPFDNKKLVNDLIVDSALFTLFPDSNQVWRYPSRMSPYQSNNGKRQFKAFNFYGEQGVVIPLTCQEVNLKLFFRLIHQNGSTIKSDFLSYKMSRYEKNNKVPFMLK